MSSVGLIGMFMLISAAVIGLFLLNMGGSLVEMLFVVGQLIGGAVLLGADHIREGMCAESSKMDER